jgi:phosphoglycerol transferase MdoB-like AlkP superfamily enzyme
MIFFIHSLYQKYFDDFASIYNLFEAHQIGNIINVIYSITGRELLFIVDIVFLPLLIFRKNFQSMHNISGRIRSFVIILLVGIYLNFLVFNTQSKIPFFESIYHRYDFVRYFGILNYQAVDIVNYITTEGRKRQVTDDDIKFITNWFYKKDAKYRNDLTGIGLRMNLIIIQVESLQNFVIGRSYNGNEITPNLNKLAKDGIYFNNIYDQTASGNTSDATFLANASLYPSKKGSVSFLYPYNCFDSIPTVLRKYGYVSAVMEAYRKDFWNVNTFDKTLGFDQQFYEDAFIIKEKIGWGIEALSDKEFLVQAIEKIKNLPLPFYVFLRTLSSHAPFAHITAEMANFPLADIEGEIIGYYIRAIHYADSAIGVFMDKLSENNLLSNSVIVIYGDHRARLPEKELRQIGISDMHEMRKIPLIISMPNRKPGETRDTIGGLVDIAPTALNILGIDSSNKFFLGRDLGNRDKEFVIFRDGSFISKNGSINQTLSEKQLMISDLIVEKNLIPLIRKEQTCR